MHPVILLLLSSVTTDWIWLLIFTRFLDHTQWRTTVGRNPLNEWSVRRRDLYLTTCWGFLFTLKNPKDSAGFEPANFGTKGQHATSRPPKPLGCRMMKQWTPRSFQRCWKRPSSNSRLTINSFVYRSFERGGQTSLHVHSTFLITSRSTIAVYTPHVLELRRAEATTCSLKSEERVRAVQ